VISDKVGSCPVCGMELKKVKNTEAIKNLKKHGFEVKEKS
jgi:transcription initiation factor IIE alpha subunit